MKVLARAAPGLLAASALGLLAACPRRAVQDVVPDTHEVRADAGPISQEGYVHVVKKRHVTMALAEARGIGDEAGVAITESLAARFEECAAKLEKEGQLVEGAARLVAVAGPTGRAEGFNLKVAPGGPVAQNALLCLMPAAKLVVFPDSDGGQRGVAIECTWGPK